MRNRDSISQALAKAKATKNPWHLLRAVWLLLAQKRAGEALYGVMCRLLLPPGSLELDADIGRLLEQDPEFSDVLFGVKTQLTREDLIEVFGAQFAIGELPSDFREARIEALCLVHGHLVIGEYARPGKRLAVVSRDACHIIDTYSQDPAVMHIHAVLAVGSQGHLLVSTGDTAKYLDLWELDGAGMRLVRRLRGSLAGHTTMAGCGSQVFLGSDFSHRPNYLEIIEEGRSKKLSFPLPAYKMHAVRCINWHGERLIVLSHELDWLGGRFALSVFDPLKKQFVFCGFVPYTIPKSFDASLHRRVVAERSLSAISADGFR